MMEFLAFTWLLSRDTWREREDESNLFLTLVLVPITITVLFAYMLWIGLEDLGVGPTMRWATTLAAAAVALVMVWDGRWPYALGFAFVIGHMGLVMVVVAAYLYGGRVAHKETGETSDVDGPRWRFS